MPIYQEIYAGKYRDIQQNADTLSAIKALQKDICSRGEITYFPVLPGGIKELRLTAQEAIAQELGPKSENFEISFPLLRSSTGIRCMIDDVNVMIWENEVFSSGGLLTGTGISNEEALDELFESLLNPEKSIPPEGIYDLDNVRLGIGNIFNPHLVVKVLQSNIPRP